jgi:hypothetical protein
LVEIADKGLPLRRNGAKRNDGERGDLGQQFRFGAEKSKWKQLIGDGIIVEFFVARF